MILNIKIIHHHIVPASSLSCKCSFLNFGRDGPRRLDHRKRCARPVIEPASSWQYYRPKMHKKRLIDYLTICVRSHTIYAPHENQ